MAKLLSLALAALLAGVATAQPDKLDDKKPVTRVYDVKGLVGGPGKGPGAVADADALVKVIFEAIPQLRDAKPGADGPQIVERDGGKLEVRTTAARHAELKDLFEALDRLNDLAIDVTVDVYEFDAAGYEKLLKALPAVGRGRGPVLFATGKEVERKEGADFKKALADANKVLKGGRAVQTSTGRFANGAESVVSARRTVAAFTTVVGADAVNAKALKGETLFVKEGFGLVAVPVASADRRFVRLKLTEQSTAITGVRTRDLGEIGGEKLVAQSLDTEDLGATGSAEVADGGTLLFKLAYAPKDKVWVAVLKPTIFINGEEEQKKEQKRLEDKVKRAFPDGDLAVPVKP
jgi:hypothetical protein